MPLLDYYSLWAGTGGATPVVVVTQLQVLFAADILVDGVAASTEYSRIKLTLSQAVKEATQLGDVARWLKNNLYSAHADGDFYVQTGALQITNEYEQRAVGPASAVMILSLAADLVVGNLVNIWKGVNASLEESAIYGELVRGHVSTESASRVVQAKRLLRAQQSATSGTGTAVNLGSISAGQALYSALHVVGTTGTPSGTVFSIVSAPSSTLAGSTVRVTFAAGTSARAGEWQELAGPITDTWFAAAWSGFPGTAFTASISAGVE